MTDKNLFQITYDVFGYSPGGWPKGDTVELPVSKEKFKLQLEEINSRFKIVIDDHNKQNAKAIEKNPKLKLGYKTVVGV